MASRLEVTGIAGRIHVTKSVYDSAMLSEDNTFKFDRPRLTYCKGVGNVHTYFVRSTTRTVPLNLINELTLLVNQPEFIFDYHIRNASNSTSNPTGSGNNSGPSQSTSSQLISSDKTPPIEPQQQRMRQRQNVVNAATAATALAGAANNNNNSSSATPKPPAASHWLTFNTDLYTAATTEHLRTPPGTSSSVNDSPVLAHSSQGGDGGITASAGPFHHPQHINLTDEPINCDSPVHHHIHLHRSSSPTAVAASTCAASTARDSSGGGAEDKATNLSRSPMGNQNAAAAPSMLIPPVIEETYVPSYAEASCSPLDPLDGVSSSFFVTIDPSTSQPNTDP
jgi:hypothetical protein